MYGIFYLFALAIAGVLGVFWGGLIPANDFADKKQPGTKRYRLGFIVGSVHIFVGISIIETMLLEQAIQLFGHGMDQLIVPGLLVGTLLTIIGFGISYRYRLAILCLLPISAEIFYLYITDLGHGISGASTDDIIGFIVLTGIIAYIALYMGVRWREFGAKPTQEGS
ncbi:hypothetical protein [Kordiimonas marina]|uniref:hypothetical protein n=1 Tax=Kordiimonas marina TaxID=2872312 RepID=UPI001FF460B9|nr:hypothetical protein [Kordiimonas marina]MCJ9427513.1 hypothetical protein [Kordiimonas marina]